MAPMNRQAVPRPPQTPHWSHLPQRYLHIGEGGLFTRPTLVHTVLGSCVAVVLHAPSYAAGGIFHSFLPAAPQVPLAREEEAFRYVDTGTYFLVQLFLRCGIPRQALVAKLFGGAASLGLRPQETVGSKNTTMARAILAELGIPIVAERLGGATGIKLLFHTQSGTVLVKNLRNPGANGNKPPCGNGQAP